MLLEKYPTQGLERERKGADCREQAPGATDGAAATGPREKNMVRLLVLNISSDVT